MTSLHPAQRKALLRHTLAIDRVLTTAQLTRRGLLETAEWLELPRVTRTCRTRVTQSESDTDLTFVALRAEDLDCPSRDLMHLAGLAEARHRITLAEGEVWRHVSLQGRVKRHQAHAEILQTLDPSRRSDWAVEYDAGYSWGRITDKLVAADEGGYLKVYWATSIHARTLTVMTLAQQLQQAGRLPHLTQVETRFVDFWTPREPYVGRPRCHKPTALTHVFPARAG
ncbi:hypothetical protein Dcar01_03710 [Deinococcus carri]|uniref:Uncharacterized protein n=1 Tax=Deinococcus carri TaxID=1211323 RepID=A0ABP9WCS9_9DEIO